MILGVESLTVYMLAKCSINLYTQPYSYIVEDPYFSHFSSVSISLFTKSINCESFSGRTRVCIYVCQKVDEIGKIMILFLKFLYFNLEHSFYH